MVFTSVTLFLAFFLVQSAAQQPQPKPAGPADYSKEAFVIEQSKTSYRFENDGTGTRQSMARVKIQSDAGVQTWGQLALGYNASTERIEIQYVRVLKADGTVVTAGPDAVQDLTSPVQREAPVYTDFRQKHVTVPSLRPGETLEFSTLTTIHTPLAAGHFWLEYDFQRRGIILDETLDVDVPAGRAMTLKTLPGKEPAITNAGARRLYHWKSAHASRDDEKEADKEDESPAEPVRAAVRLTTFQNWEEVGGWYASLEKASRVATPEVKKKAAELTAGKTTDLDKLEMLYDFVAKDFRYVSISLGMGRYTPRAAADVLRDQYGDCKDKHTLLATLAESIGLPVSSVLINSSTKIDPDFPSPSQFDHVITKVNVGKEPVWLDVTAEVAPFRLLSAAIRKKQALVVRAGTVAHLEETPPDPPMMNSVVQDFNGSLGELGKLTGTVKLTVRGDVELLLRTVFRSAPAQNWKDVVEEMNTSVGLGGDVSDIKVSDPSATREPFTIEYQVSKVNFVDWTKKKVDMRIPLGDLGVPASAAEPKKPIELGSPSRGVYRIRLELGPGYKARPPVAVTLDRDYASYKGTYTLDGNTFTAERTIEIRQREVPVDRAGDYAAFTRVVAADVQQRLSLDTPAASTSSVPQDLKAADLNRSGFEALRNGDYAQAVLLLTRVVELEPKDKTAWNNLGRAYMAQRQFPAAIDALKKQIDINPFDESAHNSLGYSYQQLRRYAEAEASFRKQLEVNPLDKFAHAALGGMFVEMKRYADALAPLEKAISLAPDDESLQVELGTAYLNLDKPTEALAAYNKAAELAPEPLTWNNIAYQLSLKGVHLDRAQQYAESAVTAVAAETRNLTIAHITERELGVVGSLASYWDTLGWVYYAKGDLDRADKLVRAAWWLSQHAEVGDHLAQIAAKRGRKDEALKAYAVALNAERPSGDIRDRLTALAGKGANVDALIAAQTQEIVRQRTVAVDGTPAAKGSADFFVVVGPGGTAEAVNFVSGDEKLKPMADAVKRVRFGDVFPDATPAKILRRGTLTCGDRCTFELIPSGDAKPAR